LVGLRVPPFPMGGQGLSFRGPQNGPGVSWSWGHQDKVREDSGGNTPNRSWFGFPLGFLERPNSIGGFWPKKRVRFREPGRGKPTPWFGWPYRGPSLIKRWAKGVFRAAKLYGSLGLGDGTMWSLRGGKKKFGGRPPGFLEGPTIGLWGHKPARGF